MTPTPEQLALATRVPYSVRDIAEAIAEAEERGHTRAVESTAIASIHKAVAAERAAVVKWLRVAAAECGAYSGVSFDIAAGKIEAAEHHPKEQA